MSLSQTRFGKYTSANNNRPTVILHTVVALTKSSAEELSEYTASPGCRLAHLLFTFQRTDILQQRNAPPTFANRDGRIHIGYAFVVQLRNRNKHGPRGHPTRETQRVKQVASHLRSERKWNRVPFRVLAIQWLRWHCFEWVPRILFSRCVSQRDRWCLLRATTLVFGRHSFNVCPDNMRIVESAKIAVRSETEPYCQQLWPRTTLPVVGSVKSINRAGQTRSNEVNDSL